jgi:hypothetical protein
MDEGGTADLDSFGGAAIWLWRLGCLFGKLADAPFPSAAPAVILLWRVCAGWLFTDYSIEAPCSATLPPTRSSTFALTFLLTSGGRIKHVAIAALSKFPPSYLLCADSLCKGILTARRFPSIKDIAIKVGLLHVLKDKWIHWNTPAVGGFLRRMCMRSGLGC